MLRWLNALIASSSAARANERAIALWKRGDYRRAEAVLRGALRTNPRFAAAAGNLGMVLAAQGRLDEGLGMLLHAVELDPRHAGARVNLAALLQQGCHSAEAVTHLREALAIAPDDEAAHANLLKPLMDLCDWPAVGAIVDELKCLEARQAHTPDTRWAARLLPFESLLLPFSAAFQLAVARYHAGLIGGSASALRQRRRRTGARLRIGYVSADFHDHATAHLTLGLYGAHDRTRFSVHAYSLGPDDGSAYRRRIAADCDCFVDASGDSDAVLARRIAGDGIDILVDMKGHTGGSRMGIFARRPAPIQVNYLGYPGTTGAGFIDYLIADRVVIPEGAECCYSEAIAFMPATYQATDNAQPIAAYCPPREFWGLPRRGFVFCCFNRLFKLEPLVFGAWMAILRAVPGSVLWLSSGHAQAEQRLRDAAAAAGVAPSRLVFAPYAAKPLHLARHRHADLFLDTHYVNAHTTATDALWAGLPVLTWPGQTFASRVAASLLAALGLPELRVPSLAAYQEAAIHYATDPQALARLRRKLAANRTRTPLFDTTAYVQALEEAYSVMHRQGEAAIRKPLQVR